MYLSWVLCELKTLHNKAEIESTDLKDNDDTQMGLQEIYIRDVVVWELF